MELTCWGSYVERFEHFSRNTKSSVFIVVVVVVAAAAAAVVVVVLAVVVVTAVIFRKPSCKVIIDIPRKAVILMY